PKHAALHRNGKTGPGASGVRCNPPPVRTVPGGLRVWARWDVDAAATRDTGQPNGTSSSSWIAV
ncbi:MAG: hypothetical protein L0Y66_11370, partial [Myxococcaceae bacterium]|nr:hypothetical protein [Myxococcaceae bacterium]